MKWKRKGKQVFAMMLAVATLLSGCAPNGIYADEDSTGLDSSIIVETENSEEEQSSETESSEVEVDESDFATESSDTVETEESDVPQEESSEPSVMPTESPEPSETEIPPEESSTPSESSAPTDAPVESTEPTEAPTESTEPTEAPTESTEPTEVPTESTKPIETPTVSGGDAVVTKKTADVMVYVGEGGSITIGEQTIFNIGDGVLRVNDGDPSVNAIVEEPYFLIKDVVIGSVIEANIKARQGYQIATYSAMIDSGDAVENLNDFSSSPYEYNTAVEVVENLVLSVSFVSENNFIDWRESVRNRESDFDGGYIWDYAGLFFMGERMEELVSMYNDPECPLSADNWESYVSGTIYEGATYEDLLYMYNEGFSTESYRELIYEADTFADGSTFNGGKTRFERIIDHGEGNNTIDFGAEWGNNRYHRSFSRLWVRKGNIEEDHFCIDYGKRFWTDKTTIPTSVNFTEGMQEGIVFYRSNNSTGAAKVIAQLYIWSTIEGKNFINAYNSCCSSSNLFRNLVSGFGDGQAVYNSIKSWDRSVIKFESGSPWCIAVTGTGEDYKFQRLIQGEIKREEEKCRIEVKKTDDSNIPLAGAEFEVKYKEGREKWVITSNNLGFATLTGLKPGTYMVTEISAPDGYDICESSVIITLKAGESASETLLMEDPESGTVIFLDKYEVGTTVHVGKYGIFNIIDRNTGSVIDSIVCGPETAPYRLEPGDYRLVETVAPEGYVKAGTTQVDFTIPENRIPEGIPLKLENYPIEVKIKKVDVSTGSNLSGARSDGQRATVNMYYSDEYGTLLSVYETLEIGDDGWMYKRGDATKNPVLHAVPEGYYVLQELVTPDGYVPAENKLIYVNAQTEVQTFELANEKRKISIEKIDANTGLPVIGVHLSLRNMAGVEVTPSWVSDGTPHVIEGLPVATYKLVELNTPEGYMPKPEGWIIDLGHEHGTDCYKDIPYEYYGSGLRCPASDNMCGGGCGNGLWGYSGEFWGRKCSTCSWEVNEYEVSYELKCDFCGYAYSSEDLSGEPDEEYRQWCKDGKRIPLDGPYNGLHHDCPDKDLLLNPGAPLCGYDIASDKMVYYADNTPSVGSGVFAAKYDEKTKQLLPGATLQVLTQSGVVVDEWVSGTTNHKVNNISIGNTYILREKIAPAGYSIAPDVVFTAVDGQITHIKMEDTPTELRVTKKDTSGNIVYGAVLEIRGLDNDFVSTWTTRVGESEHAIKKIPAGRYILSELSAPAGYAIASPVEFVVTDTREVQRVEMVDPPIIAQFYKRDDKGNYVADAVLELYRKNENGTKGALVESWVTTSSGPHTIEKLPAGDYILHESSVPFGYVASPDKVVTITNSNQPQGFEMKNHRIIRKFLKIDEISGEPIAGAELGLYFSENGVSMGLHSTWVTTTEPHVIECLPAGEYMLLELSTPKINGNQSRYGLADPIYFTVSYPDTVPESMGALEETIRYSDPRAKFEFELIKVNGSDASIIDDDEAKFDFYEYNVSNGKYEKSQHYWIVYEGNGYYTLDNNLSWVERGYIAWMPENDGKYAYKETYAPNGGELDKDMQYFDVKDQFYSRDPVTGAVENGILNRNEHVCPRHPEVTDGFDQGHFLYLAHNFNPDREEYIALHKDTPGWEQYRGQVFANPDMRGGIAIQKHDEDTINSGVNNMAQGDATLQGFEYTIYNRSGRDKFVYPTGELSPKYRIPDGGIMYTYTVDEDFNVTYSFPDTPLKTNIRGYAGTPRTSIQFGVYEVVETKAGTGYLLEKDNQAVKSLWFEIKKHKDYLIADYPEWSNINPLPSTKNRGYIMGEGTYTSYNGNTYTIPGITYFSNDVIRGGVQIQKWDKELDKSEAIGGANHGNNTAGTHLEGITFDIKNVSAAAVYVEGRWYQPGQVVKSITTHWNAAKNCYTAETASDTLPYGTYEIYEVHTNTGYLLNGEVHRFQIREDGKIVTKDVNNVDIVTRDQVIRGDLKLVKMEMPENRLMMVPFKLINVTTGETHIIVSDVNGNFNSASYVDGRIDQPHSVKTNANDWVLEHVGEEGYIIDIAQLDSNAGVWFGLAEDGTVAPPVDSLGALPYGDYILEELECNNNLGLVMASSMVHIERDGVTVDMGTIPNKKTPEEVTFKTSMTELLSGTHSVNGANNVATLHEKVDLQNLLPGNGYRVVGYLMSAYNEGEKVDYDDQYVMDSVWFETTTRAKSVDLYFTFDPSVWNGREVVAYIEVYRSLYENRPEFDVLVSDKSKPNLGKDINNKAESVSIVPEIKTYLIDETTGDKVVVAESAGGSRVIDTVEYKNLAPLQGGSYDERLTENSPRQTYIMKGKLYDITNGENAAYVVAEGQTSFEPNEYDGTVDVVYDFVAEDGHTYVAVEDLISPNGTKLSSHVNLSDPQQIVYVPKIETTALDVNSNTHVGVVGTTIIKDRVDYFNLVVGKEYTISGSLVVKSTGEELRDKNGNVITASVTFTVGEGEENGYKELTFEVDSSLLAGETVVAFEHLHHKGIEVATHTDIEDEDQSIHFPEVRTVAIDGCTGDMVATGDKTFIADTVEYKNLIIGQEYTISGVLMDAKTGEYLGKDEGITAPIIATTSFVADKVDGEIVMIFNIPNGTILQGKTCVVFENLLVNGVIVRHHEDLTDTAQTVYFPKVKTEAISDSGLKDQLASGPQTIIDNVILDNLVVGKVYTITGGIWSQKTNSPLLGTDGSPITATKTFTATQEHEEHELTFVIPDASILAGDTVVAFEDLHHNNVKVAFHHDIEDEDQSIYYPEVGTEALDANTLLDEGVADEDTSITDTVKYSNLESGATYTVKGTLYNKETGDPVLFKKGYIVASTTFVALPDSGEIVSTSVDYVSTLEELNTILEGAKTSTGSEGTWNKGDRVSGEVTVNFSNFDARELLGETVVVFEYLFRDKVLVGMHEDLTDENQDVKYPKTTTLAVSVDTGIQESDYGMTNINDKVDFENLTVGNLYTLKSYVVDKETGVVVISGDKRVETETVFTADKVDMSINVTISFGTELLQGKTFVVYEELYRDGKLVSVHTDIDDAKQTLYLPSVHTNAYDEETGNEEGLATEGSVLIDEVTYGNLTYGESYKLVGTLYDKTTGQPFYSDGIDAIVTQETYFLAGVGKFDWRTNAVDPQYTQNTYNKDPRSEVAGTQRTDGTVTMRFEFDSTLAAGKDLVVFEQLYTWNGELVGHHKDINDVNQTVSYPKVETEMVDDVTKDHESQATPNDKYIDTVTCSNLQIGKTYTVKGILMDKETGEPLVIDGKTITAEKEFVADKRDMIIEMVYELDSSALAGKDVVSFEDLERNDKLVGTHNDLEDDSQTVAVIDIHTTAIDDTTKLHEGLAKDTTVIVDTVSYENLFYPGEMYVLKGTLVDKATGEVLPLKGTENVTVTKEFMCNGSRYGEVKLEFTIDTSLLKNHDIVVYERLYKDGVEIAVHCDSEDALQTVHIPEITTRAWDSETKDDEGYANPNSILVDTISYKNLTLGEKYTVHAVVVDKVTGQPVEGYEAYKSFVAGNRNIFGTIWDTIKNLFGNEDAAKRVDGEVDIDIPFDTTRFAGQDVVVYEYVYRVDSADEIEDSKLVAVHTDFFDDNQVLSFPKIGTEMVDAESGFHQSQATELDKYIDTVAYTNLKVGETYTISGVLMDKATGEELIIDGKPVTGSTTFVPTEPNGTVEVVYEYDSSALEGYDVVSFEELKRKDIVVGTHTDITDESQTVAVFDIHTTVIGTATGTHEVLAAPNTELKDTVTYNNLLVDNFTYELRGYLIRKSTGQVIPQSDGSMYVAKQFTITERNGSVDMYFNVDTSNLKDDEIVVYEELYANGIKIGEHKDLDDVNQTIYVPGVPEGEFATVAVDSVTGNSEAFAHPGTVLKDTINYANLTNGEKYTAHAVVVNKSTGEIIPGFEGFQSFTAGEEYTEFYDRVDGNVTVEIPFDTTDLAGETVVVYEYVYIAESKEDITASKLVWVHAEIDDEHQMITFPEIGTTMVDADNGTHESQATENDRYIDTVEYSNLMPGKEYTINGILMNKESGEPIKINGEEVRGSVTFTPTESHGFVEVVYEYDSSALEGYDVVSFEDLERNNIQVGTHSDITDESQTVAVINIHTTALDDATKLHEGTAQEKTIIKDTVEYVNLLNVGEEYLMVGTLVDKATGEELELSNGAENKVSLSFIPEERDGTVVLEFEVDTSDLEGHDIVVFERLYKDGVEIATHTDVNDTEQTTHIPEIRTRAWDKVTGEQDVLASENTVIIDTIDYKNLTKGERYVANAVVVDKETGAPIVGIHGYTEFVAGGKSVLYDILGMIGINHADRVDGSVDVEIPFDATKLAGKDIVIFEYVYRVDTKEDITEEMLVGKHTDLEDEGQTIKFPKIGTTMLDADNNTHITQPSKTDKYIDTVAYENLIPGRLYTVKGILMNKETGEPLLVNGEEVHGETVFTPETPNGHVIVVYELDSSLLEGTDIVSFESLERDKIEVATHADIEDESQTVHVADIHTFAKDATTGQQEVLSKSDSVWVDRCEYRNLIVGEKYRMFGELINKDTGERIEISGSTAETVFVPTEKDGYVDVTFEVDSSLLANMNFVVYETLYLETESEDGTTTESEIIDKHDLGDKDETLYIPGVGTKACDILTGNNEGLAQNQSTLVDTVEYRNVTYGETYTLHGVLYSKTTGKPIEQNGKLIEAYKTFVAMPENAEKPDGSVSGGDANGEEILLDLSVRYSGTEKLEFVFDSSLFSGEDVVVFEYLYKTDSKDKVSEDNLVGTHTDIEDEDQTVSYPKIGTTLTNKDGNHEFDACGTLTLVDRIEYTNLTVGATYTATGTLYDKVTGTATNVTATATFVPTEKSGYVDVEFAFNSNDFVNKELVAFEKVFNANGILVGTHEDITDTNQTIKVKEPPEDEKVYPSLKTNAVNKKDGGKWVELNTMAVVVDTVTYENLNPGETYHLIGRLVEKESQQVLTEVVKEFVPESANGSTQVEFVINTTNLEGKSLVVFEYLHKDGGEVARHEDINDEGQTVKVRTIIIETGDDAIRYLQIGLAIVLLGAILYFWSKRNKKS